MGDSVQRDDLTASDNGGPMDRGSADSQVRMRIDPDRVKRILVIKLRAIGDVVLSTGVLENLRLAYPKARIDVLTEPPSAPVLEGNPFVDRVLVFRPKSEGGFRPIFRARRERYDLIIDLFGNPRSAIITLLSGARHRVGYRFGWRQYCYNIVAEPRGASVHNSRFNLDALTAIGVPVTNNVQLFPLGEKEETFAARFMQANDLEGRLCVGLNPGGGWITKRWRPAMFAQLGELIASKYGTRIVILWGPGEEGIAKEIYRLMREDSILIPPAGLKELGAVMKRCAAIVTNDSGPMHIAAALRVPILAIFGPTRPELQGPVGTIAEIVTNKDLLCLGCNLTACPIGNPCMEKLPVHTVAAAFDRLWKRIETHTSDTIIY